MQNNKSFVAIDLETTGLDFETDEIIEVALVRFENSVEVASEDYLVKPTLATLRPFIEGLTGISNKDLENAEPFANVANKIYSFIGELPIVAHNALFDSKFLKQTFEKVGINFENHTVWDSLTVSRIAFQNVPNHRLETLVQALNIPRSRAHRALPDAIACGQLFIKAVDKIANEMSWLLPMLAKVASCSNWSLIWDDNSFSEKDLNYALPDIAPENAIAKNTMPRISEYFKENGALNTCIENYKPRTIQQDLSSAVECNMHKGGICVVEAPKDSGKTLAYLIAAANKAASGERVVISTASRTLQDKLWNKNIPQILSLFSNKLKPAILKSRDNYICLRKFEEILNAPQNLLTNDERDSFMAIIPWVLKTVSGDVSECHSFSQVRNRVLWSKMSSSAKSCLGEKCKNYAKCPALAAKRRAMNSNLLLVNHSLFVADMSLDFALLPLYEHIVFDEAHLLPQVSSQIFSRTISFFNLRNIIRTLSVTCAQKNNAEEIENISSGLLLEIYNRIKNAPELQLQCLNLCNILAETEKSLHRFFMKLGKKLAKQKNLHNGFSYKSALAAEYDLSPATFTDNAKQAIQLAESLVAKLKDESTLNGLVSDLSARITELSRFVQDFEFVTKAGRSDWVFYMEEPFNPHTIKLHASPINTCDMWKEKFYSWIKSATFISDILTVQGNLDYFVQKMKMNELGNKKRPFLRVYNDTKANNYQKVIVAKYLPKPSQSEFNNSCCETLCNILPEISENAVVLFTSMTAMLKAQSALAPVFAQKGKLLLCQQVDGALDGLINMFRKTRGACLLGFQDLWNYTDFPIDALKLLVIPKLPFPNPTDPIIDSVSEKLKEQGKNAFKDYFVPEAYTELRKGLSRLISSDEKPSKVLILDNRVVLERYSKTFTYMWNNKQIIAESNASVLAALK